MLDHVTFIWPAQRLIVGDVTTQPATLPIWVEVCTSHVEHAFFPRRLAETLHRWNKIPQRQKFVTKEMI